MSIEDILNNPLAIQSDILSDYMSKVDGGYQVVDANNSFMFLVESFSRTVAEATVALDSKLNSLYPKRANTTKELYNHLSDFDYVGFYSSPASLKMKIMLHKDYIAKNALQVPNTNYRMIIIPKDTIFTVGRFKLGLYYPIHIQINTVVNGISAIYDTSEPNPLHSLNDNGVKTSYTNLGGIELVVFEFDAYQFNKTIITETITPDLGFIKKYSYTDKFYAIRVFDIQHNKELEYTMSDSVYDTARPTVNLKVYPETNEIELAIPQIYFTDSLIGNQLRIELYTTQGAIDASLSSLKLDDVKANFAMTNSELTYTNILRNIPTIIITPVDSKIVGGSDSKTFTQIKDFTIYHNGATTVPITRLDLERYFESKGFKALKKLDNLTDRKYYSYKKLTKDGMDLAVVNGALTLDAITHLNNSSIKYHSNGTVVILPTVIYRFLKAIKKFEILSDSERATLLSHAPKILASNLNSVAHYCNPHHIMLDMADRYPKCRMYDLFTTNTDNISFISENIYLSIQLNMVSIISKHLGDGAGGYLIRIGIQRSLDAADISTNDINIYMSIETNGGYRIGVRGEFVNAIDGIDVYDFRISTNYKLEDDIISVTNLVNSSGFTLDQNISLSGKMMIATFIKKSLYPTIQQDFNILARLVEDDDSWLSVSLQSFNYILGTRIDDVLDSGLLVNWTGLQYETYPEDVPMRYDHDVFETNLDGTIKYSVDINDHLVINKLFSIGEEVRDTGGNIIIQHYAGDIKLDVAHNPITIASKTRDFTIEFSGFDYRHRAVESDFLISLSSNLAAYYSVIREMDQNILENTKNYFRPIMTTGEGTYRLNNTTTITSDLEVSFEFGCYVSQTIFEDDKLIDAIKLKLQEIVQDNLDNTILSIVDITSEIKDKLSDYIVSMDIIAMNGNNDIQTLMNIETDKSPRLGFNLIVGTDGRYLFVPKITLNFKPLDL